MAGAVLELFALLRMGSWAGDVPCSACACLIDEGGGGGGVESMAALAAVLRPAVHGSRNVGGSEGPVSLSARRSVLESILQSVTDGSCTVCRWRRAAMRLTATVPRPEAKKVQGPSTILSSTPRHTARLQQPFLPNRRRRHASERVYRALHQAAWPPPRP